MSTPKTEGQINLEWSYPTHFQTAEWFYNLIGENYHSGHFLPKARSNNRHSDLNKKNKKTLELLGFIIQVCVTIATVMNSNNNFLHIKSPCILSSQLFCRSVSHFNIVFFFIFFCLFVPFVFYVLFLFHILIGICVWTAKNEFHRTENCLHFLWTHDNKHFES